MIVLLLATGGVCCWCDNSVCGSVVDGITIVVYMCGYIVCGCGGNAGCVVTVTVVVNIVCVINVGVVDGVCVGVCDVSDVGVVGNGDCGDAGVSWCCRLCVFVLS